MMIKATFADITIRSFTPDEFEPLAAYWTDSSAEYWASLGIDKTKMKTKEQFIEQFNDQFNKLGEVKTVCVIEYKGHSIGVHTVNNIVDSVSATMHAHIFDEEFRRKNVAYYSYPKAIDYFIKKLKVEKILFKTPIINVGANRVKEKLGIPCLGDTIFESPIALKTLPAKFYEVDRKLVDQLLLKIRG